ncbi:MAG: putative TonB-dependent receptor, partial [Cytophagaceae bacterium]|nr:putative TonB-dependent receptor [Cytophagaceae bacterium]
MTRHFYLIFIFWVLSLPSVSMAQSTISGFVKDDAGLTVELVNVVLLQLPDSTEAAVAFSDSLGAYTFENVKPNDYVLVAMQLGYEKIISKSFTIDDSSTVEFHFTLVSEEKDRTEITVTGKRPVVRQEADKMVVSVENMLATSGLSAIDVLKRSPGISVDKDGAITLRGKTGVLILLDDRPLYMTAEQAGNLLKAIPSDQIKEIEIITTPSAKYDAAGNAGIINIRLKKGAYEGFNGSTNISYGQGRYHKFTAGVNSTYKKNKVTLNGGYQYNNKLELEEDYIDRMYQSPTSEFSKLHSYTYYRAPRENHTLTLSGSYNFTERTSVSLDLIGSYGEYGWDGTGSSYLYKKNGNINNSYFTTDYGSYGESNINTSLGFNHKLDTNGTVISGTANYNRYTGISNKRFEIQNYDSLYVNDGDPFLYIFRDPSYNNQYSVKADFTGKAVKSIKVEAGLKAMITDKSNPAHITITQNGIPADSSNSFDYKDGIYAGYLTLNRSFGKKWKAQAGLRVEHTEINGIQKQLDTSFTRSYTDLFPSGNLTYNATDKMSYTILYSRRIQRPNPWELNPVLAITDPYTAWGGNAYLQPEYTDNVELSQSLFSGYVVTTVNYSYTKQPITWVVVTDTATLQTLTQPRNLEKRDNMGVSIAVNMPITKWWTTSCYALFYQNRFVGDMGSGDIEQKQTAWNANTTQTFTLSKKTTAEISGFYNSTSLYGLRRVAPRMQLNLAVQKKIMANKATLKLAVNDVFWTNVWYTNSTIDNVYTETGGWWDNRTV